MMIRLSGTPNSQRIKRCTRSSPRLEGDVRVVLPKLSRPAASAE